MIDKNERAEFRLGELAVSVGLITAEQLNRCLALQSHERLPLGQILLKERLLSLQQLTDVIELQAKIRRFGASNS